MGVGVGAQRLFFLGENDELWSNLEKQLDLVGIQGERHDPDVESWGRELWFGVFAVLLGPSIPAGKRLDLCRHLRATSQCLVVVISGDIDEVEELRLVAAGVSDIVHLPLRVRVLAAKLANRSGHAESHEEDPRYTYGNLELSPIEHWMTVDGTPVNLTPTEFDLLALLMDNPRRVYTHEELSRWIWQDPWSIDHHRLEAHVCRLRRKIVDAGGPVVITSIRGVGYRLLGSADIATRSYPAG